MKKIILGIVAVLAASGAQALSLDTYTGVSNAVLISQTAVADGAVITSKVFTAKALKGIGTLLTIQENGTNTAGGGYFTLQDSSTGSSLWSNVTTVAFANTNAAGSTYTKVDLGAYRPYYRVLCTVTADANRVTATLNGYQ